MGLLRAPRARIRAAFLVTRPSLFPAWLRMVSGRPPSFIRVSGRWVQVSDWLAVGTPAVLSLLACAVFRYALPVYTATFTVAKGALNDASFALGQVIAKAAEPFPRRADGTRVRNFVTETP